MGKHLFFAILYFSFSSIVPAVDIGYLLILHCIINIISDFNAKRNLLYVMTSFYVGVILTTFSNINFILKVEKFGITENMMYAYIDIRYVKEAMLIWAVCNTFIFMGYELFNTRSFPSIRVDVTNKTYLKNIYIFIVVMLVLHFTGHAISVRFLGGGAETALSLVGAIGILFFARIGAKENNRTYMIYAITLTVAETFMALVSAFLREDLIIPLTMFYGGYIMGKGHIKHVLNVRLIPAVLALFVFFQFFQTLGGSRAHFIDAINFSSTAETSNYIADKEDPNKRGGALERISNIAQLTSIVNLTVQNGFYKGRASAPLVAAVIPRALWPDKPIVQLGAWFALEIGGATRGESGVVNNSINMTIPGELYLDFGWFAVIIGGLLFGGLIALFWNTSRFNDSPYNLTGCLWGGYLMLYALSGIGADLQIVISLFSTYLVFYIIKRITKQNENYSNRALVEG